MPNSGDGHFGGNERFEVKRQLGAGGMGIVYEVYDRILQRPVALKTVRRPNPHNKRRFKKEFRALANARHPRLVRLRELNCNDSPWYFTMDLIKDAEDLLTYLRGRRAADDSASKRHSDSAGNDGSSIFGGGSPCAPANIDRTANWNASTGLPGWSSPPGPNSVPSVVRSPFPPNASTELREAPNARLSQLDGSPVATGDGRLNFDRVRQVFRELAEGVLALHGAGKLHRDLKPANALVCRADGHVVLLDFGLVTDLGARGGSNSVSPVTPSPGSRTPDEGVAGEVIGTIAYMAPEQARPGHAPVGRASDWYSVGVMLYEVLTGRLPFAGRSPQQVMQAKQEREPGPPSAIAPNTPPDLDQLCVELLRRDPTRRPSGAEVLERLSGTRGVTEDQPLPFVGREAHLQELQQAYARAAAGETVIYEVHGRSGAGKSALMDEFLTRLTQASDVPPRATAPPWLEAPGASASGPAVLAGRCFEQESVPYKGVDCIIDALTDYLRKPDGEDPRALLPPNVTALARVFPVLNAVEAIAESVDAAQAGAVADGSATEASSAADPARAGAPGAELADLIELRKRAFAALRELLRRLAERRPVVIAIDDVQWGDADSGSLLAAAMRSPGPARVMLVLAYRSEHAQTAAFLRALREGMTPPPEAPAPVPATESAAPAEISSAAVTQPPGIAQMPPAASTAELGAPAPGATPTELTDALAALAAPTSTETLEPQAVAVAGEPKLIHWGTLHVDVLTEDETRDLATRLATRQLPESPARDAQVQWVVRESGGSPLFVDELVRHLGGGGSRSVIEGVDLDDVLWMRVNRLTEHARHLLGAIAIAGRPLRILAAGIATDLKPDLAADAIDELRAGRLIRSTGGRLEDEVEAYHDRVRESVVDHLPPEVRRAYHAALASALVAAAADRPELPRPDAETLAKHCEDAGRYAEAAEHTLEAAEQAVKMLAFERAEALLERAGRLAPTTEEKAAALEQLIHFYTNTARFADAYDVGRRAAALFGVELPRRFTAPRFLLDFVRSKIRLRGRPIESIAALPLTVDGRIKGAVRVINAVAKAAYQVRPELCVAVSTTAVNLCLRYGNTEDCAIGYMVYGAIFQGGVLGDHRTGYAFGQLVLDLVERYGNASQRAEVNFVVGYFGTSWMRPVAEAEALWDRAFAAGIASEDLFHTGCAAAGLIMSHHMRGVEAEPLLKRADELLDQLRRYHLREPAAVIVATRQFVRNLRGQTNDSLTLSSADFDESEHVRQFAGFGSRHFVHFYHVLRTELLYLRGQYDLAAESARVSAGCLKDSPGMLHAAEHHFYAALVAAARGAAKDAGVVRRWRALREVRRAHRKFARWASRCEANFRHKERVLAGEIHRLAGRSAPAIATYDEAVTAASKYGYVQIEALAHQLAARLIHGAGDPTAAGARLELARTAYRRWGADDYAATLDL